MLQKKYIRIILGALCVFLLLSLLSSFVEEQKCEGFEVTLTAEDKTAFRKVMDKIEAELKAPTTVAQDPTVAPIPTVAQDSTVAQVQPVA